MKKWIKYSILIIIIGGIMWLFVTKDTSKPLQPTVNTVEEPLKHSSLHKENNENVSEQKKQWVQSLTDNNPFVPENGAKGPVQEEPKEVIIAADLNLYSIAKHPGFWEFGIESISSKKRYWLRSDKNSETSPFMFINFDESKRTLTVKNKASQEVFTVIQKKSENRPRSSSNYSSYEDSDDIFMFNDFDEY